jgi:hypothetical protein
MDELDAREERAQTGSEPGACAETDGLAICTEPAGHGPEGNPLHWDKHTEHEWSDDEAPDLRPIPVRAREAAAEMWRTAFGTEP